MGNKHEKLGMNPSTAAHRLRVDLLFEFAVRAGHVCFRCQQPLVRDSFSIEHKEPWQSAIDPKAAFFDLGNIAYSHLLCNIGAAEKPSKYPSMEAKLEAIRPRKAAHMRLKYTTERRREKFQRTGH